MGVFEKDGEKYFEVVSLTRTGLLGIFENDRKMKSKIKKMSDDDLEYLAKKLGDALTVDGVEETLETIIENDFSDL
jgi:hypothetical protein